MAIKILLADDEEDLEDLFRQQFRRQILDHTYEFIFVTDGTQALAALEQHPDLDIFLSDINMPGIDGLSLLTKVPTINPILRTVIITAYGDMSNIRTAMNEGAFDFLTKPINFRDLQKTLEKTIRSVAQQRETAHLKAMDDMKTRFFANITHELRTPLSLIISPLDNLLETADLTATHQQQLATVQRNARQLLRLINQLLDINKLEAEQMEVVYEVGDLPSFVGQMVDLFRPSTDIKQLALTYQTDLPAGTYLFDTDKWAKILYNLLSNAIKFTDTGQITVSLTHTSTGVQLQVSDTGIGIAPDKLPHIFNRFYQVDSARNRAYEGTGIGLALVRELSTRLGGSAHVYAQEIGPGTRFMVEIPLPRAPLDQPTQPLTFPPAVSLLADRVFSVADPPSVHSVSVPETASSLAETTPLLLLVEDNAELREFIVTELAMHYRIRSAANGYEGLLLARDELPDLIITDLMMPRMDGYELIEQLRVDIETSHIPVVVLTAELESTSRLKGLALGADEFLTKPFSMNELRLRLRNLLTRQANLRESYRRQLAQAPTHTSPEPLQKVEDPFLRQLYEYLEAHLDDSTLNVEWLAGELSMSRRKLHRKLQTLLQLSPHDVIRQYRLRRSIDLLQAGYNASETAYRVGFESPSYFTKVFKEFYSQTPSEYLRR
ncbi:Hybrid signal transduction histidine kinase D [Fibrisoma limi BUZ 3]|uniref:histidine kinase n=1 Tax=Fibrisoma limi BUZ 3 TaxID=1185876 RepID=I2GK40_9BACT|nr:response regulator [Fibrisoma limi]CCH54265.1 Hybrid signal transduction histidine kinase D [Fibrisoma limi BUZ 3]